MDFGSFDTRTGAEEGRFLHLRHLQTEQLLYDGPDGPPVGLYVRGLESRSVQAAVADTQRRQMEGGDIDTDVATARALVISFQGIERDGRALTTSVDDLDWFFGLSSKLVKAVLAFTVEPGNFLPAVSKD